MKTFIKLLLLWVFSGLVFFLSYFSSAIINQFILLDSTYMTLTSLHIYYLIGIKVLILSFFIITKKQRYSYIRTLLGILASNATAVLLLIFYLGMSIKSYIPYGINLAVDFVLIFLLIATLNKISSKRQKDENLDDINEFMGMKKDLEALKNKIYEKKEELSFLETMIKDRELDLSKKQEEIAEAFQKIPFASYYDKEQDQNQEFNTENENLLYPAFENLEQISKIILNQVKVLEEKESYIDKQIIILERKQKEYNEQLYHILFDSPELGDDEVKLKDKHSEIIIKKGDLAQIKTMVERALEE